MSLPPERTMDAGWRMVHEETVYEQYEATVDALMDPALGPDRLVVAGPLENEIEKLRAVLEEVDEADYKTAYENLLSQHRRAITNQRKNVAMIQSHIPGHPDVAQRMCQGVIEWCEENGAEATA